MVCRIPPQGRKLTLLTLTVLLTTALSPLRGQEAEADVAQLQERVEQLETELREARRLLRQREDEAFEAKRLLQVRKDELIEEMKDDVAFESEVQEALDRDNFRGTGGGIQVGDFTIGGAIRASYILGDFEGTGATAAPVFDGPGPSRDGQGGVFTLDTVFLNVDWEANNWYASMQYRFQGGTNFGGTEFNTSFPYHAYLGYFINDTTQIEGGIVNVPWGVAQFGASVNFFETFDTLAGLSNDRDLGVVIKKQWGDFDLDVGYFAGSEPNWRGNSTDSNRGSYDLISTTNAGLTGGVGDLSPYKESHQVNLRAAYNFDIGSVRNRIGVNFKYGELESTSSLVEDGDLVAFGGFTSTTWGNWQLLTQVSVYDYNVDNDNVPFGNEDQVVMGGLGFPYLLASQGVIPSVSLSYTWFPQNIDFIDFIVFYSDYSALVKSGSTGPVDEPIFTGPFTPPILSNFYGLEEGVPFRDSQQITNGMLIGSGSWLIFMDLAFGQGAPLIGSRNSQFSFGQALNRAFFIHDPATTPGAFGFDPGFQMRFNINFGYYF